MTPEQKAVSTAARAERTRAQAQRYSEQAESVKVARLALTRLTDSDDTTPTQLLKGLELLARIAEAR